MSGGPWFWVCAAALALPAACLLWQGGKAASSTPFRVVYVTAPSTVVADSIAEAIIKARLAACVNIIPGLTSHYMWEGQLEKSEEVMLVIKSSVARLERLEVLVKMLHPYDVPEFLVLPVDGGSSEYFAFLADGMSLSL
jgi:periplasmic divalent cation tolerance protein